MKINRHRSRDAPSHPSLASRFKKALPTSSPTKKGGGAPTGAPRVSAPPQKDKPASVCGARYVRPLPRIGAGFKGRRARLSALHRGHAPRALPRTRFRAALPGITGSKREDPLRHQCSQHLAVRSRAGWSMPKTARTHGVSPRFREPPPLRLGVPSRRRPSSSGILIRGQCNRYEDHCQVIVSTSVTARTRHERSLNSGRSLNSMGELFNRATETSDRVKSMTPLRELGARPVTDHNPTYGAY